MEKILFDAMNHLTVGVHIIDLNGRTIVYNQKMSELESMEIEDVLNKNIYDVFQFQENEQSTLLTALSTGKPILNVKQKYFNNRGREIMTMNHTYPLYENEQIVAAMEVATDITKMERLIKHQKETLHAKYNFDQMIGVHGGLKEVIELAKKAARTASNVLLVGEDGTGKEGFVKSIHDESERAEGPFVLLNCSPFQQAALENELFGTTRDAFVGAENQAGLFEKANGGTLLIDALNEMPIQLQMKVLHVLKEKEIVRVGGTTPIPIDVRIIATINEEPFELIMQNKIQKDLYYKLAVVSLIIPPLRERLEDLDALIQFFITKYNDLLQMQITGVSPAVRQRFQKYSWPGNVRELEHIIESAMNSMEYDTILDEQHLPYYFRKDTPKVKKASIVQLDEQTSKNLKDQLFEAERTIIEKTLVDTQHHITLAAKKLGLSRQSLQYRMKRLGLQ